MSLSPREGAGPSASSALGRDGELWQKESSGISMAFEGGTSYPSVKVRKFTFSWGGGSYLALANFSMGQGYKYR